MAAQSHQHRGRDRGRPHAQGLTTAANGTYTVVVGNAARKRDECGAVLLVATPIPGRLINLSVRTNAGRGAETLIAGFVVGGTGSKQVLVRAVGPTLADFGVTGSSPIRG